MQHVAQRRLAALGPALSLPAWGACQGVAQSLEASQEASQLAAQACPVATQACQAAAAACLGAAAACLEGKPRQEILAVNLEAEEAGCPSWR